MMVMYAYLKKGSNIVACLPFRYNIDDAAKVESREIVLDADTFQTYEAVKQELVKMLDKEKMDNGEFSDDFPGGMSGVVTIE